MNLIELRGLSRRLIVIFESSIIVLGQFPLALLLRAKRAGEKGVQLAACNLKVLSTFVFG